jgi:hypothetical protein
MKHITFVLHEPSVNRILGDKLNLQLEEKASVIDAIIEVDKLIKSEENFSLSPYQSLLHMVYNPSDNRFYKQTAIVAYKATGEMLNVRDSPEQDLPEGATVILIPAGGCISEWEEAVSQQEFLKAMHKS